MTLPYRKKLIEVGLPLVAINAESAREKSIRHGHPSTLHLWWARRPLAACRAVLFSSLVDDPDSDPRYRKPDGSVNVEAAGMKRADLFNLIEELVMWENSNNADVIRTARAEIARCVASRLMETGALKKDALIGATTTVNDLVTRGHCRPVTLGLDTKVGRVRFSFDVSRLPPAEDVNAFLAEHAPPVLDPFAGGGSIPLEAQRLGLRAYASDLNPVAVLINKALIEIPPKFAGRPPVNPASRAGASPGSKETAKKKQQRLIQQEWPGATGLADDVRYYGQWMRDEAEKRIGHLYPKVEVTAEMAVDRADLLPSVGQKLTVIAWLWARTVASPNPLCGGLHIPLMSSFWLSQRRGRLAFVEPIVDKRMQSYRFAVRLGEPTDRSRPMTGTVGRNGGTCILTDSPVSLEYIREEGAAGRLSQRLIGIIVESKEGRSYLAPNELHEEAARVASSENVPDTDLPKQALGFRVQKYGILKHRQLFTNRQLQTLSTLAELVNEARNRIMEDYKCSGQQTALDLEMSEAYANAVALYLAFSVSRQANRCSSQCFWDQTRENVQQVFARNALPFIWDYCEANPFSDSSGNFLQQLDYPVACIINSPRSTMVGKVEQLDAAHASAKWRNSVICTDPPYYDNIGYGDLSDFFYIWLRRCLRDVEKSLCATLLTPKDQEIIAEPGRHSSRHAASTFFENRLSSVFKELREVGTSDYPMPIFYAFKQSEEDADSSQVSTGWDTFLQGLVTSGWQIGGTWPLRTEQAGGLRVVGRNALASSIVVSCRPRLEENKLTTRKEFLAALRRELPDALRNLQRGNIAPVDLAQAAIGPGMAVFTRYAKVLESNGSPMTVRTALGIINQSLDEVLAEQEGEFDSDTRWALAWFEQFGMSEGPFGDAETLSKAKNTAVNGLVEAGIIKAHAGKVRLVKRDELPNDWNPATDKRLTAWEVAQHLIHRLDQQGEVGASLLVNQLGSAAEISRDLAYRLYSTCERKKWAQEALAYNSLVVAWPELSKLALASRNQQPSTQQDLFS